VTEALKTPERNVPFIGGKKKTLVKGEFQPHADKANFHDKAPLGRKYRHLKFSGNVF